MKNAVNKLILPIFFTAAFISSCASMKLSTVTKPIEPVISKTVQGSKLLVSPVMIDFVASRPEFDLRDVKITIQGQTFTLGGRYLDTINDIDLGKVGILDTNIFKKAKVDVSALSSYAASRVVDSLEGDKDLRILIDREKPDVGEYSSRPLVFDFSKYPYTGTFSPEGKALPSLFSSVSADPGKGDFDYTLDITLTIRSEVYQIQEDDINIQTKFLSASHQPSKGDYYLEFYAWATFDLKDKNGTVVMNEKTKQTILSSYAASSQIYIPVHNHDADAYAKYFRNYNFTENARNITDRVIDQIIPALRPMYQNINQFVRVE